MTGPEPLSYAEACDKLGADLGWYLARLNQSHAGNLV
jgi:hypothetical protein